MCSIFWVLYFSDNPVVRAPTKTNLSASYIILCAEDKLNITITQNMITTWNAISSAFAQAKSGFPFIPANTRELTVLNDIGYASRVELLVQELVNIILINILYWM